MAELLLPEGILEYFDYEGFTKENKDKNGYGEITIMLSSTYNEEGIKQLFRPTEEMQSKMWILWFTDLIWAYFFTFIFVKGYENKGIMEGVKYGVYIGLFYSLVMAYQSYAIYPIPYSLTFKWFAFGFIQSVILGVVVALIYKPKEAVVS